MRDKIELLSDDAKTWLHHAVQQCNDPDADGYCDNKKHRAECVDAGVIIQHRGSRIEIPADVNDLVYRDQYLGAYA